MDLKGEMKIPMLDRLIAAVATHKLYVILVVIICLIFSGIVILESDALGLGQGGVSLMGMLLGTTGSIENLNNNPGGVQESPSVVDYVKQFTAAVTGNKIPEEEQHGATPAGDRTVSEPGSSSPPTSSDSTSPADQSQVKSDEKVTATPTQAPAAPTTQMPATVETTSPMVPELDTFITVLVMSMLLVVFTVYTRRNNGR